MATRRTPAVDWTDRDGRSMSISVETRRDRWRLIIVCNGEVDETPWAKHVGVHRLSDASILESAVFAAERHLEKKGNGRGYNSTAAALLGKTLASVVLHG